MATKKKVEQSVVTKAVPKGKPAPKRVRPSRAKKVEVIKPLKPARVTASVGTRSTDPILRLDPDLVDARLGMGSLKHESGEDIFGADNVKDPATYVPANSPIRAEIAERLAVYQLELEYKHYEDDSNPVASLIKRNAQEASTHSATLSLVIDDYTKYVNDGRSASGSGVIELAEGGQLTEELKYYVHKAIDKFTSAVDSRITVTRAIVQRFTLPGIVFII